jgi:hypothetical protein
VKLFEISKNVISASGILRLERLLAKKLGTDIYRFGGASGELKTKSGDVGYLYFYKTHAFRLDYDKSEQRVAFIDFWTDGAKAVASMKPNFQLVLPAEVSIFKLMSSVAGFLKHPKAGDITVSADDLKEGVQDTTRYDMSEARRVSPEEFITKAKQFAVKQGKKDMIFSYDDLRDIGKAYDIMIPGGFYEVGVGGKDVQSYDLGRVQQASDGTIIRVLPASESHRFVFQEPTLSKDETEALEGAVDESYLMTWLV